MFLRSETQEKELLRFLTAGSVDDGKSTLIGRLLYEAEGVYEDQLASIRKISAQNNGHPDLSLITDGLKAEREQAITIDVAYRYFSTARRKFILADVPGHEQYTRNMATGASTADLAVVLVDARKGVLEQTKRHAYISWLLGIRRIVVAINKMDLVGFDRSRFEEIRDQFLECTKLLAGNSHYFIPTSALDGDNVVYPSRRLSWYEGPSLLQLLETVPIQEERNLEDFRFPVQGVIRPNQDCRGYTGQVVSGIVKAGQEVIALPSKQPTRIEKILVHDSSLEEAFPPLSVCLFLSTRLDLGRGDMLADPTRMPMISNRVRANLIWMSRTALRVNAPYLIRHTSQTVCGSVLQVRHKTDVHNFEHLPAQTLLQNEIGEVEVEMHKAVFCDPYSSNRATGSFIMIDPGDNDTVAAGMILGPAPSRNGEARWPGPSADGPPRQHGLTVWFTGLSGAGKTTICRSVFTELLAQGLRVELLDGDDLRRHLNSDLGFSREDREENVRRIGFVARLLARNGVIALVAAISPYRAVRDEVRRTVGNFIEVHVNAPLSVCEERDPKGLYRKARAGEIKDFTGIDDPYEAPLTPEVRCDTDQETLRASTDKVVSAVMQFLSVSDEGFASRG